MHSGSEFDGTLRFQDALRIDGTFSGRIEAPSGELIVGQTGHVTGVVIVETVSISGSIEADVVANRVELMRTGRLVGRLVCSTLVIEEGGVFRAPVRMVASNQLSISALPSAIPVTSTDEKNTADLA
jgi:cytoskeletal protein CcmA (bactofilin family)